MDPEQTTVPSFPHDVGRLLAPRINFYAQTDPSRTYASIPRSSNLEHGFREITYAELARAIDRASHWLDAHLSKSTNDFSTFGYVGPNDLRYVAIIVAAIKTNRKTFLPSSYLPSSAFSHLLKVQNCEDIVFGTPLPLNPWFDSLEQKHPALRKHEIPAFDEWFSSSNQDHVPYPYKKTWEQAIDNPVFTIHSSGTTGMPKTITYRNSTLVYFDAQYQLGLMGHPLAINYFKGRRTWSPLPLFHLGGIYAILLHPVYFHTIPVLSPPGVPLTASLSDQTILYGKIQAGFYPPFLLDDITTKPVSLKTLLEGLEDVDYGTAPLNKATADKISGTLHIQPHYASTEFPFPPYYRLQSDEWEYFSFHPFAGIEFVKITDDLHELVVVRNDKFKDFQPNFTINSDLKIYKSGDLWSQHPTKPGLWRYRGRTDDIIVLTTGINVHTSKIESAVQEDPNIRSAIVGGHGRVRPYLILELTEDAQAKLDPRVNQETLWPSIQAVNERLELDGIDKILKDYVIVAPPSKPFKRLPKGSVDRRNTMKDFEAEIEQCY